MRRVGFWAFVLICITSLSLVHGNEDFYTVDRILNHQPFRFVIPDKLLPTLQAANWHDKASLEAVSNDDLDEILRSQIENFKYRDRDSAFPIIGGSVRIGRIGGSGGGSGGSGTDDANHQTITELTAF